MKRKSVLAGLCTMDQIEPDQGDQHKVTPGMGVEDKLDSGINPLILAPDTDQEEHRNNLDLPEEIKEEEIGGQEDSHNGSFHEE